MRINLLTTIALTLIRLTSATEPEAPNEHRIFQATNEWQVVPEGYEIPGGLHVKMDFETGEKQAKLPNPSEDDNAKAIVFNNSNEGAVLKEDDELLQQAVDDIDIQKFDKLEDVADWAHDIEYGEKIAASSQFLTKLISLIGDFNISSKTRELAARIFGASFRNNPAALNELFKTHESIVSELLDLCVKEKDNALLQSRLIYALGSLLTDSRGIEIFRKINGETQLQHVFSLENTPLTVKSKCAVLVEKLLDGENRQEVNKRWSDLFQQALYTEQYDDGTLPILETLTKIHEQDKLTVQKDFLKWLASTSSSSKNKDPELHEFAKSVRHRVFGNPNAQRKEEL